MSPRSLAAGLATIFGMMLPVAFTSCSSPEDPPESVAEARPAPSTDSPFEFDPVLDKPAPAAAAPVNRSIQFSDVAPRLGLNHVYQNGEQGKSIMVETTGGGAGWIDYDRDGQWDLYLNQGGVPTLPPAASQPTDTLHRNLGEAGFQDITQQAWIQEMGYGQGLAVGDFDNDGFDDIYVTNVGTNTLWRNMGDGTFQELAADAGVDDPRWSSTAAWYDLDQDGDLDLYVCNYLQYDPYNPLECRRKTGELRICHPKHLEAWPDECYFNQGDGTFTAEARQRGLFGEGNKALGVAIADFNNDGLPDIYVANDTKANFLFMNQGDARFKEEAYLLGCAVERYGAFQASMGLGIADVDHNGFLDIYSTHYYGESNTLYLNYGETGFEDATAREGLHQPTMSYLAFGVVIEDFDQNGFHDMFILNGHVDNHPGNPLRHMRSQLLSYDGRQWQEVGDYAGPYFDREIVGRGVAAGDFDNDGDWDLASVPQNDAMSLLQNDSRDRGNWLKLEFRGIENNRRGIGARATIKLKDRTLIQQVCGGTTYASSHQPALLIGLGDHADPVDVEIRWPNGQVQVLEKLALNSQYIVDERNGVRP